MQDKMEIDNVYVQMMDTEQRKKPKKAFKMTFEHPNLDLSSYIQNYSGNFVLMTLGNAKVNRLLFIADHCPSLKCECLILAQKELLTGKNVAKYQQVCQLLKEWFNENQTQQAPETEQNLKWIDKVKEENKAKVEQLENELRSYQSNMIKESIRVGYNEIGKFYEEVGQYETALKTFTKTREYCTSQKHLIEMNLNLLRISLEIQNYSGVLSYSNRILSNDLQHPSLQSDQDKIKPLAQTGQVIAMLEMEQGLWQDKMKNSENESKYKKIALLLLSLPIQPTHQDFNQLTNGLSANDILMYVVFCGLSSFTRKEIKEQILESPQFRSYLELDSRYQSLLELFCTAQYEKFFNLLKNLVPDLLLDLYLNDHLEPLMFLIRKRAMIQYCQPYQIVSLPTMAQVFEISEEELENEIIQLILAGSLNGKINGHLKQWKRNSESEVDKKLRKIEKTGKEIEKELYFKILKMRMKQLEQFPDNQTISSASNTDTAQSHN